MIALVYLAYAVVACLAFVPITRYVTSELPNDDDLALWALAGGVAVLLASLWIVILVVVAVGYVFGVLTKKAAR